MSAAARKLDQTFLALADPTRRGVVELLRETPRRAGELAEKLDVSAPALSRHLKVLREAGLVEEKEDAIDRRARVYELARAPFRELAAWIDHVEAYWTDQLDAFRAHVEKRGKP